ncbi:MFS transporter [Acholeplasma sp. OttesenSCG-928-E16]|nr:MFS transporter [Acholeplasma sp. OttesenSCG-928-E16]
MRKLTSKKQELLYAFSGFGPNLLMILASAYLLDAVSVAGYSSDKLSAWTFTGQTIVITAIFSVIVTIAQIINGIADVPLANFSDNLRTKWGRRRPAILMGFIPTVIFFICLCFPLSKESNSLLNTIWFGIVLVLYFIFYTLTLVNFYATFSEITETKKSRNRLSLFKATFDVFTYSIAYALIPLLIGNDINIQIICLAASPLMLTMLIPLFMIKEERTDLVETEKVERIKIKTQFIETLSNKKFMIWMIVFSLFYFGLQLFLAAQNVLADGAMGLEGYQIALINTAAFAPVPFTLILYQKIMKKKGFKLAFQTAILSFVIAVVFFMIAYVKWIPKWEIRFILGLIGSTIGSYGIGAFFASPYMVVSQIAASDMKKTGKNNSSMFFAVNGLINAIVGGISTGIVWLSIKEVTSGAEPINGLISMAISLRSVTEDSSTINMFLGVHIATYIIIGFCLVAFFASFKLPKDFDEIIFKKDEILEEGESN